ncbi:MAG TPA: hypothetical protein VKQ30_04455, partial [Ktedonobacterales bacterium]|nr:hypothetical protein [Ktedonobacterales bacterium]
MREAELANHATTGDTRRVVMYEHTCQAEELTHARVSNAVVYLLAFAPRLHQAAPAETAEVGG